MGELPPAQPLRIVGFVPAGQWGAAIATAVQLSGYAPSMIVRQTRPSRLRLAEADYLGISVVVADPGQATVVVAGRHDPVLGAERIVAARYHEERLFEQWLDEGPDGPERRRCAHGWLW